MNEIGACESCEVQRNSSGQDHGLSSHPLVPSKVPAIEAVHGHQGSSGEITFMKERLHVYAAAELLLGRGLTSAEVSFEGWGMVVRMEV